MKNILLFIGLLFLTFNVYSQTETSDSVKVTVVEEQLKFDVMKLFDGKVMNVHYKKMTPQEIFYVPEGSTQMLSMDRRFVNTITYKNGEIDIINEEFVEKKVVSDFRKIKVTKKKRDVKDMIEVGQVEAMREGKPNQFVSVKSLERNALIELRKRAAYLNAHTILITKKDVNMGYGETPQVTLYGTAYKEK